MIQKGQGLAFIPLQQEHFDLAMRRRETPPADVGPEVAQLLGEVGLSGEVRAVGQTAARMKEAAQLGFRRCLIPKSLRRGGGPLPDSIEAIPVRSVAEAVKKALV